MKLPILLVAGGILLLATGLLWPVVADPRENWSAEQAEIYAETSAALHAAAHAPADEGSQEKYKTIQQRFESIKKDLESARDRPVQMAFWIKLVGSVLSLLGLVMLVNRQKQV